MQKYQTKARCRRVLVVLSDSQWEGRSVQNGAKTRFIALEKNPAEEPCGWILIPEKSGRDNARQLVVSRKRLKCKMGVRTKEANRAQGGKVQINTIVYLFRRAWGVIPCKWVSHSRGWYMCSWVCVFVGMAVVYRGKKQAIDANIIDICTSTYQSLPTHTFFFAVVQKYDKRPVCALYPAQGRSWNPEKLLSKNRIDTKRYSIVRVPSNPLFFSFM